MKTIPQDMISATEVSELLGVLTPTLAAWRSKKVGPPFYKRIGRITYSRSEVQAWELAATTRTSTN
jgi:predicted DNA-binding transcriptional regulator AlpA